MNRVIVTTSWDDGHVLDVRLAEVLRRYGVAGTFYVSPHNHEFTLAERLSPAQIKKLARQFEIGAHTLTHPRLNTVSLAQATAEIVGSKNYLEELLGRPVRSFCYPGGVYTAKHQVIVRQAGLAVGRTVARFELAPAADNLALGTSVQAYNHLSDWPQVVRFARGNPRKLLQYRHWDVLARAQFDRVLKRGGVFHLWGHSWEIEAHNDWERLEKLLAYMSNHPTVEYLTNGELVS